MRKIWQWPFSLLVSLPIPAILRKEGVGDAPLDNASNVQMGGWGFQPDSHIAIGKSCQGMAEKRCESGDGEGCRKDTFLSYSI